MKRFRDFAKNDPAVIGVVPVHGRHARMRKILDPSIGAAVIGVIPVHGGHAKKSIKEAIADHGPAYKHAYEWADHNENHHLGERVDDVHHKLDKRPEHFHKHEKERAALRSYTEGSHQINRHLVARATGTKSHWDHDHFDDEHDEKRKDKSRKEAETQIKHLDNAIHKSKLEHDVHVYHGLKGWHPGDEARKHNGHIKLPAYTSTSIKKSTAQDFSGADHKGEQHVLHIHMKKGQKGKYLGSNSEYDNEKEMLLPRNTVLKIHPRSTKHGNIRVWHCTVHSQEKD